MAREEEGLFDDLARGLADGSITRGRALRLMGAALVGGALGSLGIGEASADPIGCKRNGKHCTRPDQCCSGNCASGTCQERTTTTTAAPTTTTTTTTPTTTTTSTTTTPRPCTADTDCVGIELCDPDTNTCQCPGCYDTNGVCQEGLSTSACRSSVAGLACAVCQPNEFCASGCRCSGCYDAQGVCQAGSDNGACGFRGVTCAVCAANEVCAGGECVCSGCRDTNGVCQPGTSTDACGFGGGPCANCGTGGFCEGGSCII
jgi:hypothetical protein